MRFRSDSQRRAVFRRLSLGRQTADLRDRVQKAPSSAVAAATATGIGASIAPWVTHLPADKYQYLNRGALRESGHYLRAIGREFPHLKFYGGLPAATTLAGLAYHRYRHPEQKQPTLKQAAAKVGTAGALGLGTWLGERSIVHSIPAFLNKPFVGRPMTKALRAELLLGHALPLAIAAGGVGMLTQRVARRYSHAREVDAPSTIKSVAPAAAGTLVGHWLGIDQAMARGLIQRGPKWLELAEKGIDRAVVPSYLSYRLERRRRTLAKQRARIAQRRAS